MNTNNHLKKQWRLFEERWRDKCGQPCVGQRDRCDCWQWSTTRAEFYKKQEFDLGKSVSKRSC